LLDWELVVLGLCIGLAVAAPIGPANILCIHRGVRGGFWPALTAGLGAMVGDGLYAAFAAFGLTAISDPIEGHLSFVKLVGGFVLVVFGYVLMNRQPHPEIGLEEDSRLSQVGAAVAAFLLVITNPALLFGFIAIFAGLDKIGRGPDDFASAGILTLAVTAGSFLWWLFLALIVTRYRNRITQPWLKSINRIAGLTLALFGAAILSDVAIRGF